MHKHGSMISMMMMVMTAATLLASVPALATPKVSDYMACLRANAACQTAAVFSKDGKFVALHRREGANAHSANFYTANSEGSCGMDPVNRIDSDGLPDYSMIPPEDKTTVVDYAGCTVELELDRGRKKAMVFTQGGKDGPRLYAYDKKLPTLHPRSRWAVNSQVTGSVEELALGQEVIRCLEKPFGEQGFKGLKPEQVGKIKASYASVASACSRLGGKTQEAYNRLNAFYSAGAPKGGGTGSGVQGDAGSASKYWKHPGEEGPVCTGDCGN